MRCSPYCCYACGYTTDPGPPPSLKEEWVSSSLNADPSAKIADNVCHGVATGAKEYKHQHRIEPECQIESDVKVDRKPMEKRHQYHKVIHKECDWGGPHGGHKLRSTGFGLESDWEDVGSEESKLGSWESQAWYAAK